MEERVIARTCQQITAHPCHQHPITELQMAVIMGAAVIHDSSEEFNIQ